jgi:hypothetical protein
MNEWTYLDENLESVYGAESQREGPRSVKIYDPLVETS